MKRVIAALIICLLLTGCWDQVQLKKMLFVDVIGIDFEGDSKEIKVDYVISSLQQVAQGGGKPKNLHIASKGDNLYDAAAKTYKEMPGNLAALETRLFLISTRFAKDQPLSYLDMTGQFIANPLYGYLAVYDGDLSKLLSKEKIKEQTLSEFLVGLLDEEKRRGRIPSNKVVHYILGGAEFINDFVLNRFEPYENGARLAGTSLFSDGKYTGVNLNDEDTQIAYLMNGARGRNQPIISKTDEKNYTVLIQNAKQNFHIISNGDNLREIEISLKLDLKLVEEGHEDYKKHTKKMLTKLENEIAADITTKATNVIATLQKANCDYLQLGHEVAAYHPKLFEGLNWRKQYPKISIKPKVKIRILNTGILD
ncbi:Ger(x)C family spore germination protein [Paenibacillus sp. Soil787]|uniref:Ger(x)C family spore germination protein n=1 Tax=Paenibacillus sp. Soil787 TaxID=1736411 RepID=UPI0006FA6B2A|nr:Ger(x)C family spore germination protein [Paenibacillus sp. Soil787]KRF43685.1 spore gernimation protein GerC [Paenibacillus sp. Soil787]